MNVEISFRNVERLAHLEEFVLSRTQSIIIPLIEHENYRIDVCIDTDRHRSATKRPHFTCEVLVQLPGRKKTFVVRKSSFNFYEAVLMSEQTLKKILRKDAACKARHTKERKLKYVVDQDAVA